MVIITFGILLITCPPPLPHSAYQVQIFANLKELASEEMLVKYFYTVYLKCRGQNVYECCAILLNKNFGPRTQNSLYSTYHVASLHSFVFPC